MESEHPVEAHEQTIIPVKAGIRASAAAVAPPPPAWHAWLVPATAVVVVIAVVAVFFALPRWLAESAEESAARVTEPAPADPKPSQPQFSAEELAALEARAEKLLAELLPQQRELTAQGAASWGADAWTQYAALARTGDDAYLAKSYQGAVSAYEQALAAGEALFAGAIQSVAGALAAAREAFTAGNAALAIEQYDLALSIEPDNSAAKLGRAQAERLPEVLALTRQADDLLDAGSLEEAAGIYRQALSIDATWEPARTALASVASRMESNRFENLMSAGFTELAAGNFAAASEQFTAALQMRPNASDARDGLVQAEQGQKLDEIALAEARALAFERRERWDQAVAQYEAALATDSRLTFATTGLARARTRADLDAKLANLLDNPDLLLRDDVLPEARSLREKAGAIAESGPRLEEQKTRLDRLLTLAATPLKVELRSDEQTDVTLYRVGPLGAFVVKQVELRPGTYTAVGSRNGYRDVRQTFTVLPGRELPPINVVCSEPI